MHENKLLIYLNIFILIFVFSHLYIQKRLVRFLCSWSSRFFISLVTFFAQQQQNDKIHSGKARKILFKKKYIFNLSNFFLGIAKILLY